MSFLSMFQSPGPVCQSCSMPLSGDPQKGGTETDGRRSTEYCSYCYQHGQFINPMMTMQEMQAKAEEVMRGMGMSWLLIKLTRMNIPRLKRWKNS